MELTILMPCLNEAETLARCITKAQRFLRESGTSGEVLVADNGSTDGSQQIAQDLGARVVEVTIPGYGSALSHGVRSARGKFVIMGDSDDSYDFSQLEPFLTRLREGFDLVMGDRFAGGIRPGAMPFKNRYLGNPALSAIGRLLFRAPVRDFHCGLRGFSKQAFDRLDLQTTGMEFASEMVIKATLMDFRIAEVGTTLDPAGRTRRPHLRPWRDGWRHLRFMLLYSPRWLFLYPGLTLIGSGTLILIVLMPGPLSLWGVRLDANAMLFGAAFVLLGYQAVLFSAFSTAFVVAEKLVPPDPWYDAIFRRITLETGLVVGASLALAGLLLCASATWLWQSLGFGDLDTSSLRLTIPGVLAAVLGVQTIGASFFLSILGMGRK